MRNMDRISSNHEIDVFGNVRSPREKRPLLRFGGLLSILALDRALGPEESVVAHVARVDVSTRRIGAKGIFASRRWRTLLPHGHQLPISHPENFGLHEGFSTSIAHSASPRSPGIGAPILQTSAMAIVSCRAPRPSSADLRATPSDDMSPDLVDGRSTKSHEPPQNFHLGAVSTMRPTAWGPPDQRQLKALQRRLRWLPPEPLRMSAFSRRMACPFPIIFQCRAFPAWHSQPEAQRYRREGRRARPTSRPRSFASRRRRT